MITEKDDQESKKPKKVIFKKCSKCDKDKNCIYQEMNFQKYCEHK